MVTSYVMRCKLGNQIASKLNSPYRINIKGSVAAYSAKRLPD